MARHSKRHKDRDKSGAELSPAEIRTLLINSLYTEGVDDEAELSPVEIARLFEGVRPRISMKTAFVAKAIPLSTGKHTGILLANIVPLTSDDICYKFILAVRENQEQTARLAVTAEVSTLDLYEGRIEYLLCCFHDGMHHNSGPEDLCGDLDGFERVAVKMAVEILQEGQRVREGRRNAGGLIEFLD
jgi:hypothetical protein